MVRTAGGHRRLAMNSVLEFIRKTGQPLVAPEVLGLPTATGSGGMSLDRAQVEATNALVAGDEIRFRRIVFDLYLSNHTACELLDDVVARAFHEIGERWSHGDAQVYQERRAIEICNRVLVELRSALPNLPPDAPLAVGGSLSGDPYSLPTTMVDIALREIGWRAESLGTNLPANTLVAAIQDLRPRIFWLSVSAFVAVDDFLESFQLISAAAQQAKTSLLVGGRTLSEDLRRRMDYSKYCDTLKHTVSFAESIWKATKSAEKRRQSDDVGDVVDDSDSDGDDQD